MVLYVTLILVICAVGKPHKTYTVVDGISRMTPLYNTWFDMYQRCTSERSKSKRPHYRDTKLHKDWYIFKNFAEWAEKQVGYGLTGLDGHTFQIDKDLLGKGDVYSPESCCFLPKEVNAFLKRNRSVRNSTGFTGVSLLPNGKFRACVRDPRTKRNKHLGCFLKPEDAYEKYLLSKSEIGKYLANTYKQSISKDAFLALSNL